MSIPQDILEKIDDYLDGVLNDTDLKFFEAKIHENPELKELIALNKVMRNNYNDGQLETLKKRDHKEIEPLELYYKSKEGESAKALLDKVQKNYNENEALVSNRKNKYWLFGIAASILVLIGWFFIGNFFFNENYYESYNDWQDLPSLVSKNNDNNALLIQGEEAFLNKDFTKAKDYFESFIETEKTLNPNALIYLGISELETGFNEDAIKTFDQLIVSKTIDASKGYWYKALVYLKMEDNAKALKQLKIIIQDSQNYNYKEAQELIKKIEH